MQRGQRADKERGVGTCPEWPCRRPSSSVPSVNPGRVNPGTRRGVRRSDSPPGLSLRGMWVVNAGGGAVLERLTGTAPRVRPADAQPTRNRNPKTSTKTATMISGITTHSVGSRRRLPSAFRAAFLLLLGASISMSRVPPVRHSENVRCFGRHVPLQSGSPPGRAKACRIGSRQDG